MKKKVRKKFSVKLLIICLVIVYAVAFIGSLFTSPGVSSDYYDTVRPSLTPPNWVFPVVWNILFFLIGISLFLALTNSPGNYRRMVVWAFGINLLLNILWSVFYFSLQSPLLAFIDLLLLLVSIVFMILVSFKVSKASAYLLIPYLLWVSFAGILNFLSI